jgi:protein lifeguard
LYRRIPLEFYEMFSDKTIYQEPSGHPSTTSTIEDDFMYGSNVAQAHVYIRMGFLRKVYGILSVQLLMTTVIAGFMMYFGGDHLKTFLHTNPFVLLILFLATIVNLVALSFKKNETPANYVLLFTFTALESAMVGCIVVHYSVAIVIQALVLTCAVTVSLSLYALQTKRNLSHWGGVLMAALVIIFVASILQMFLRWKALDFTIAVFGAFVFCLFIIFDTWMIMNRVSPEEYIVACIDLYLDIINLFIYLLQILNELKGK